jgi:hypothetical protein
MASKWAERQKAAGKCVSCGPGIARPNKTQCSRCVAKPRKHVSENHKRYRERHPERVKAAYERWRRRYEKDHPEYFARFMKRWKSVHPKRYMVNKARDRSKKKGLPFAITAEDIHIPQVCPVLGIPLFWGEEQNSDNSPSLDCLIPALGYTKGNIFVISTRANRIKNDATLGELEKITNWTRERLTNVAR